MRYLVNAGQLESGSWYLNDELEGSRFAGEGGHFIDTLSWWADSLPVEVYATGGLERDDVQATVRFENGAVGTIAYLTGGNSRYPKETFDATGGGRNARLDNFKSATVCVGRKRTTSTRSRGGQDKGQAGQMAAFVSACLAGGPLPISLDSLLATTRATLAIGESLASGKPASVSVMDPSRGAGRLGWYLQRVARMSPSRGWLARARPGAAQGLVGPAGQALAGRRRSRRADAEIAGWPSRCRPHARDLVPVAARKELLAAADRLMDGEWEVLGVHRDDLVAPDWFSRPGHRQAARPPTSTRSASTTAASPSDRQHQADLGDLPAAPPHAALPPPGSSAAMTATPTG